MQTVGWPDSAGRNEITATPSLTMTAPLLASIKIIFSMPRHYIPGLGMSSVISSKRAKNATQHAVPLAPLAMEILRYVPRFINSDLVFTTNGKTSISGFGRFKRRLDTDMCIDNWRVHDIRRTVATNMAILGIAPHVIEAVLNHKTGIVSGVAAVYNRHAYMNEKREALERWADQLRKKFGDANQDRQALLCRASGGI